MIDEAVLAAFVREGWLEEDAATAMLAWPHSGFGTQVERTIAREHPAGLLRMVRCSAREQVAESRLRYAAEVQGLAFELGKGRIVVLGEGALVTAS